MNLKPLISEKSFSGTEKSRYTFRVPMSATKISVKLEVKKTFGVTAVNVNTAHVPGKVRRRGRITGQKPGYKKAIVTLKKGDKIKELEE